MQPACTELSDVGKNSCSCGETEFYFCDISFHGHIYHLMGQGRAVNLKRKKVEERESDLFSGLRAIFPPC